MQPSQDYPQMVLQQAAVQFISDLQMAGHHKAAQYLRDKYLGFYETNNPRIQYTPPQPIQPEQLLRG